jgi:glyoxalase family protein
MTPSTRVNGLHHITAISGPAQENLDFYAGVLGMRLVKKSVNQDDPGTYHLFYADAEGHPGADLTFFPWGHLAPARLGHGLAVEVSLEIPRGSVDFWQSRLDRYGATVRSIEDRFGDRALMLGDPHGLNLALVESARAVPRAFTPWEGSPVSAEHQIRGLYGARVWERDAQMTATFLTGVLGFSEIARDGEWTRFGFDESAGVIDVRGVRAPQASASFVADAPEMRRGAWGVGSVHHLAWRVDDERHQHTIRTRVEEAGAHPTPVIDRFWFKSVYFKEPGGVLFEIATDGPGFAVDEDPHHLGEALILPPWLEPHRAQIEEVLPSIAMPALAGKR